MKDEPHVRHYASAENALKALKTIEREGKAIRVVYAQDRESGIKLLANQAWFVRDDNGEVSAFLLKGQAEDWAKSKGGKVLDFNAARAAVSSEQLSAKQVTASAETDCGRWMSASCVDRRLPLAWQVASSFHLNLGIVTFAMCRRLLRCSKPASPLRSRRRSSTHVTSSLRRVFAGYGWRRVVGIALGIAIGRSRRAIRPFAAATGIAAAYSGGRVDTRSPS